MKTIFICTVLLLIHLSSQAQWHQDYLSQHVYKSKPLKSKPKQKWVFDAESTVYGPALKYKSDLFFGDVSGFLYSINTKSGTLNWKFKTEGKVLSCPSIKDSLAYFGSYDGYLYCLNIHNGNLIWKFKTGSGASCSPPLVLDKKVYFGSHDNFFYVVNRHDGNLIQKKELGHGNCTTTSFENNSLYLADWGGNVHCLDSETLENKWKYLTNYKVYQTPTIDNDQILIPSFDSTIYAIDKQKGKLNWELKINSVANQIGVKDDIAFFNTRASDLYAIDRTTGKILWKFETNQTTWGFAVAAGDVIYFGSGDDRLYAIDLLTGRKLWDYMVDEDVQRPSIYDQVIYFPSGSKMYALH